jgi:hypothetical protein
MGTRIVVWGAENLVGSIENVVGDPGKPKYWLGNIKEGAENVVWDAWIGEYCPGNGKYGDQNAVMGGFFAKDLIVFR